jgi:hypothetical protein
MSIFFAVSRLKKMLLVLNYLSHTTAFVTLTFPLTTD